jgi:hypothetical protein
MADPAKLSMNLFCNEGDGLVSIVQTDRGPVSITPMQFVQGWQGRRPPFSNGDVIVNVALAEGTYEVAGWANDEVRASWTDPSGKRQKVLVSRRGQAVEMHGDPTPPEDAERKAATYLNVAVKTQSKKENSGKKGMFDD